MTREEVEQHYREALHRADAALAANVMASSGIYEQAVHKALADRREGFKALGLNQDGSTP